jgi:hypothetical protein
MPHPQSVTHFFSMPITKTMPRSVLNHTIEDNEPDNSYRVSSEVRMFLLDPSMMLIDSSTAQVVYAPASSDTVSPIQQTVDPSMVLGARSSSGNNEAYIYISPNLVPPGWKVTKFQVNWSLRNNHDDTISPAPSLWSGQTGFYVRKKKTIMVIS